MSLQTEPATLNIWEQIPEKLHRMYTYGKIITPGWIYSTLNYLHQNITTFVTSFANRYDPETMIFALCSSLIILIITLILNDKINSQIIKNKNNRIDSLRQDIGKLEDHLELQNSSNLDLTKERFRLNKELKTLHSQFADMKKAREKLETDRNQRLILEEEQEALHTQNIRAVHKKHKQDKRSKKDAAIRHIIDIIHYLPTRGSLTNNTIKRMYSCIDKLASEFDIDMRNTKDSLNSFLNYQIDSVEFTRYIADTLNPQICGST